MNPYELHPEDREKMKSKLEKNKIDICKLKSIIVEYRKDFKIKQAPLWGYNKGHIDKILAEIIEKVEEEIKNDS
tara:strand:- start:828 stop:1049 length:222 start_codon:yes stop_codon:yes gene_type:complete